MRKTILCFFAVLLPLLLSAQEDLRIDREFFQSQKSVYQQWLDVSGLGDQLKVHEISVEETFVHLYLAIPTPYTQRDSLADYVILTWEELKNTFDAGSPVDLETQLFLKTLHIMDLEPAQATVQLYDTYDLSLTPLFFVGINFEEDRLQVETSGHKATKLDIEVPLPALRNNVDGQANISGNAQITTFKIRDQVKAFMENRFRTSGAKISILPVRDSVFQFTISPLVRQVLADQQERLICAWLSRLQFNCSTLKKEKLSFTFTVSQPAEDAGYQLRCVLDGKFSEVTNLLGRRSEYKDIDVDEASSAILREYGEHFMGELQEYLMKQ